MRQLLQLDPMHTVALEFADFGSVYSMDGREHPVNGQTPVAFNDSVREQPQTTPAVALPTPNVGWPDWLTPDFLKTQHIGARVVVGIIAIAIVIIVALRLTR